MFSRNADANRNDTTRSGLPPSPTPPVVRETVPPAPVREPVPQGGDSVIAKEDRLDGNIRAARSVRVLGEVKGKIDAPSVRVEQGAKVAADVTADDVVIAGEYSGTLVARGRLEVQPSGRISGKVEAQRLMLHDGASVDGEMHMFKAPVAPVEEPSVRAGVGVRAITPAESEPVQPAVATGDGIA
jgi:cytoskeletal protein CcmA (bactofilin family)